MALVNAFIFWQPATELIREIAILEFEVGHLEQYLLSLYRQAFDQQISSTKDKRLKSPLTTPRGRYGNIPRADIMSEGANPAVEADYESLANPCKESNVGEEGLLDSGINRCYSSLSQCAVLSARASPPAEPLDKALRACHSQPLSMIEVTLAFICFSNFMWNCFRVCFVTLPV